MRVLLDECVPVQLARALPGHEVRAVVRIGWAGTKNGRLLERASNEFDVVVTVDRALGREHTLPPGLALIVMHVPDTRVASVVNMASKVLSALEGARPGDRIIID